MGKIRAAPAVTELMEAKSLPALPAGDNWIYEPKWDGFRCLAIKNGGDVVLQGKSGKPLGRYFPEVVKAISSIKLERLALDGEIIIRIDGELSFDALQMRLHPAESRILKLSKETPAIFTTFDTLLGPDGTDLSRRPFAKRRSALGMISAKFKNEQVNLTKQTVSLKTA